MVEAPEAADGPVVEAEAPTDDVVEPEAPVEAPATGSPATGAPASGPPASGPPASGPPASGPPSSAPPPSVEASADPLAAALAAAESASTMGRGETAAPAALEPREAMAQAQAQAFAAANAPTDEDLAAQNADLRATNEDLRQTLAGASTVIDALETPPMPPVVGPDFVIPAHRVTEFVRIGRQLHREGLVHGRSGNLSIMSPEHPGMVHASRAGCALGQLDETQIVTGRLGQPAPEGATSDWRIHEVLLAIGALEHDGPAACLHVHPAHTTALSLDPDAFLLEPIDDEGATDLPQVAIVDADPRHPEQFLRQLTEGVQLSGNRAVVVRGHGAYTMGPDLQTAWRWAATLEHSMRVLWLSRMMGLDV